MRPGCRPPRAHAARDGAAGSPEVCSAAAAAPPDLHVRIHLKDLDQGMDQILGLHVSRAVLNAALLLIGCAACLPAVPSLCNDDLTFCGASPGPLPYCVDLQSDTRNCGSCGRICAWGGVCLAGSCACPRGEELCTSFYPGLCVDLANDNSNCGVCGLACGAGSCAGGTCVCASSPTVVRCAGSPVCVDTSSDPQNCGQCGTACPLVGEACLSGTCACPPSRPDVCRSGTASACVDLLSDRYHCGDCATTCATFGVCSNGACACPSGTTLCTAGDICADLATDASNCGACGSVCYGDCVAGSCQPAPPEPPPCGLTGEACCGFTCYFGTCDGFTCQ